MPRRLAHILVTAAAAALLAASPAAAKPDPDRAYYRDLFYRTDDVFKVKPIPTAAPPAQARPAVDTPADEDGPSVNGLALASAAALILVTGLLGRRAWPSGVWSDPPRAR
jgi:hypothetical protein